MSSFAGACWVKSSYSSNPGGCVEVARTSLAVGVRDTKDPYGATLVFERNQWTLFLHSLKA